MGLKIQQQQKDIYSRTGWVGAAPARGPCGKCACCFFWGRPRRCPWRAHAQSLLHQISSAPMQPLARRGCLRRRCRCARALRKAPLPLYFYRRGVPGLYNITKRWLISHRALSRGWGGGGDHTHAHQPLRPWPATSAYGFLASEKSKP